MASSSHDELVPVVPPHILMAQPVILRSQRNAAKLTCNGFFYHKRQTKDDVTTWTCSHTKPRCSASAKTRLTQQRQVVLIYEGNHYHEPKPLTAECELAFTHLRQDATKKEFAPIGTLLASALETTPPASRDLLPHSTKMRRSASNARAYAKRSRHALELDFENVSFDTLADLRLPEPMTKIDGHDFLLFDKGPSAADERFLIFGSDVTTQAAKDSKF